MNDGEFRQLLERLDLSWKGYARVRKVVRKRLGRHMRESGIDGMDSYLERIERDDAFRREVERLAAVPISRFFRDDALWKDLEREVIPAFERQPGPVRIWSAGCAMGQEVYSIKILWMILDGVEGRFPRPEILATDLNPDLLERARKGTYPARSLQGISREIKDLFFHSLAGGWCSVREDLKEGIRWERHDLIRESVPGTFQIIFLRNSLLTYYRNPLQVSVLAKAATGLENGGFLVIGCRERIPSGLNGFMPVGSCECVFRKGKT